MVRYVHAIPIYREPLVDGTYRLKVLTLEEGKAICTVKPRAGKVPPEAPSLYVMEAIFTKRGIFRCLDYRRIHAFTHPYHFTIHLLCLPLLEYYPIGEPSQFLFGRYLSALRRSKDPESAKVNTLWFIASVLTKEGLIPKTRQIEKLIITRRTESPRSVWKQLKKGIRHL